MCHRSSEGKKSEDLAARIGIRKDTISDRTLLGVRRHREPAPVTLVVRHKLYLSLRGHVCHLSFISISTLIEICYTLTFYAPARVAFHEANPLQNEWLSRAPKGLVFRVRRPFVYIHPQAWSCLIARSLPLLTTLCNNAMMAPQEIIELAHGDLSKLRALLEALGRWSFEGFSVQKRSGYVLVRFWE